MFILPKNFNKVNNFFKFYLDSLSSYQGQVLLTIHIISNKF